jgi:hypothetical protein
VAPRGEPSEVPQWDAVDRELDRMNFRMLGRGGCGCGGPAGIGVALALLAAWALLWACGRFSRS